MDESPESCISISWGDLQMDFVNTSGNFGNFNTILGLPRFFYSVLGDLLSAFVANDVDESPTISCI